jgi:hypothetical protein
MAYQPNTTLEWSSPSVPGETCVFGGGQFGVEEPPYGQCLDAGTEPPVPPEPIDAPTRTHSQPYSPLVTGRDR